MTTTVFVLCFLLISQLMQWVAWGGLLTLGLKWARSAHVTIRNVVATTIATHVGQIAVLMLFGLVLYFARYLPPAVVALVVLSGFAVVVLIPILLVRRIFQISFWRSVQSLLPTLLVLVVGYALAAGVMQPFLWEGYTCAANSMAPTLVGQHWRGVCPQCGNATFCTPRTEDELRFSNQETLMICEHNFHVTPRVPGGDDTVRMADRMLVAKYRSPERWDLVVFRLPADPRQIYVKRLVGLPGEKIVIKKGVVWANGERLKPPGELQNIEHLDALPGLDQFPLAGTAENPAELGDDEYFVLGDFSASSSDSRFWGPSSALSRADIIGVVVLIYWPPNRWREF